MPDPYRSEEDETRQQYWCQYDGSGVRCSDCPGASKSHLQGRPRCKYHVEMPGDPDKSSASSSGKVSEAEPLSDEASKLSLEDCATPGSLASASEKGKEPETDSIIRQARKLLLADHSAIGSCCVISGVSFYEDIVSKRRQEIDQKQNLDPGIQCLSVEEYLSRKRLRPFAESPDADPPYKKLRELMEISEHEIIEDPEPQTMQQNPEPRTMQISESQMVMQNPEPQTMQISESEMVMQNPEPQMMQQNSESQMVMQNPELQRMQIPEHQLMQNSEENHSVPGRASVSTTPGFIPTFDIDPEVGLYPSRFRMKIEESE